MQAEGSQFIRPDKFWRDLGLKAGETVVHLGSGPGFYLIPAAEIIGKDGSAVGVDVLPHLLSETGARAKHAGVEEIVRVIRANIENDNGSTLPNEHADWVLVANILHQSDPNRILKEAGRIVKNGGKIVVVEWNQAATPFGPPPEKRPSPASVKEIMQTLGVAEEKEFAPSEYHYGLVFART